MSSMEMSLTEWLVAERARLEEFAALWRRKSDSEPYNFPPRMQAGGWDEQFIAFLDRTPLP